MLAKKFGMKVTRYFVGFGPTIWSTWRGETEYGIKALPLGGFVKIVGMHSLDDPDDPADEARSFRSHPAWQRIAVLCAGSAMHFLLALALIFGLALGVGIANDNTTQLGTVSPCVASSTSPQLANGTCTAADAAVPGQAGRAAGRRPGEGLRRQAGEQLDPARRRDPPRSARVARDHHRAAGRPDADSAHHAGHRQRPQRRLPGHRTDRGVLTGQPGPRRPVRRVGVRAGHRRLASRGSRPCPGADETVQQGPGEHGRRPGRRSCVGAAEATGTASGRQHRLAVQGQLRAAAHRLAQHLRRRLQHAPAAAAGRRPRRGGGLGADPRLARPSARCVPTLAWWT